MSMFKGTLDGEKVFMLGFGKDAKETCSKLTELSEIEKKLETKLSSLGKSFYFEFASKTSTEEYKKFESEIEEIKELYKRKKELQFVKNEVFRHHHKNICPECGKKVKSSYSYCIYCGTSLEVEETADGFTCPKCNETYTEKPSFCGKCGTKFE